MQWANAIGHAKHRSRSYRAVIRVYDESGNVIETHEHAGNFIGLSDRFGYDCFRGAAGLEM
jgi:hypothetical protein